MDSLTFLQTKALDQLKKANKAYNNARIKEIATKHILDKKEKESYKLRDFAKSETEYQNRRREFISEAKADYENAREITRAVVKRYEILRDIVNLHKYLANNIDQQINLQKYNA